MLIRTGGPPRSEIHHAQSALVLSVLGDAEVLCTLLYTWFCIFRKLRDPLALLQPRARQSNAANTSGEPAARNEVEEGGKNCSALYFTQTFTKILVTNETQPGAFQSTSTVPPTPPRAHPPDKSCIHPLRMQRRSMMMHCCRQLTALPPVVPRWTKFRRVRRFLRRPFVTLQTSRDLGILVIRMLPSKTN